MLLYHITIICFYLLFFILEIKTKTMENESEKLLKITKRKYQSNFLILSILLTLLLVILIFKKMNSEIIDSEFYYALTLCFMSLLITLYKIKRKIIITSRGVFQYDIFEKIIWKKYYWRNIKKYEIGENKVIITYLEKTKQKKYIFKIEDEKKKLEKIFNEII